MAFDDTPGTFSSRTLAPLLVGSAFLLGLCLLLPASAYGLQSSSEDVEARNVDVILAIDLSKTMQGYGDAADIFDRVQRTAKDLIRGLEENDTVTIIPFGDAARALTTVTILSETERRRLFDRIDDLTADQSWTYTAEALRLSIQEGARLRDNFPDHRQVVFILTDGRNNPPPGAPDRYDLDMEKLAEQSPSDPWYVYQVQYGDQMDMRLDSLVAESDILEGDTVRVGDAGNEVDSLRERLEETRFNWDASTSSLDWKLTSADDSASGSAEFTVPDGMGASALDVTLDRSALPEGMTLDYEIVSQPENRARLNLEVAPEQPLENGTYDGALRIALPSDAEGIEAKPLEIPLTVQTSMFWPTWLLWLMGIGGGLLVLGGGMFGYRAWKKRQLFGELEYWPTGNPDAVDSGKQDLDQFGMSATIGSDILLSGEDEIGDLSVEEVDGQRRVTVQPRSRATLKHEGKVKMDLTLSHGTRFKLGDWTFEYSGVA